MIYSQHFLINMTAHQLLATLKFITALDSNLAIQRRLEHIRDVLNNLVKEPANTVHQAALANALEGFANVPAQLSNSINPSQAALISDMGGATYFDPEIYNKIMVAIQSNAMTPSVARDFVQNLAAGRAGFIGTVDSATIALERLNIIGEEPQPDADLSFLIPRDLFSNHLGPFAKELAFINTLIAHVAEGVIGKPTSVELQGLSSSIPTIMLTTGLPAIAALLTIVSKFLEAWEKIAKIRRIRDEMSDMGITGPPVEHLEETITTTVDTVVEESTSLVLSNYKADAGRKNELENALRPELMRLFGQIERGLVIEFRAKPNATVEEPQKAALSTISDLGPSQFPGSRQRSHCCWTPDKSLKAKYC